MSKKAVWFPVLITVMLLLLAGCLPQPTLSDTADEPALHWLIAAEGQVVIEREGWQDFYPISPGMSLRRGDLLRPQAGGKAVVLCADLSLYTVATERGCPCQEAVPVLTYQGAPILVPRQAEKDVPYVLSPRATGILEAHPVIRWHDTGAGTYTVIIWQGSVKVWQQTGVEATEIRYPEAAPLLQPGRDYLVVVVDETTEHSSEDDPARGTGFHLLTPEEQEEIANRREQIEALSLDEAARRYALALYYDQQGLRGEAVALLESLASDWPGPAVALRQGDIYLVMRLPSEAAQAYDHALERAEAAGDLEAQALAHAGLWRATGEIAHRDEALRLYQRLGDEKAVQDLQGGNP